MKWSISQLSFWLQSVHEERPQELSVPGHKAGAHFVFRQKLLSQSDLDMHDFPSPHLMQPLPQSISVSPWFCFLSKHVALFISKLFISHLVLSDDFMP